MIEFHAITPQGRQLVAQLVDGKLVIPPASPPCPQVALPPGSSSPKPPLQPTPA